MHPQDYSDARSESRSFSRNRSAPSKRRQADARRRGGRYADIHWPLAVAVASRSGPSTRSVTSSLPRTSAAR